MKKAITLLLLAQLALAVNVSITAPVTEATLYSNGFAFIKRQGTASVGTGPVTFLIANFSDNAIFSSISATDTDGTVFEVYRYESSWNETTNSSRFLTFEELLNRSIGQQVTVALNNRSVSGTLVWYDPARIALSANGRTEIFAVQDITQFTTPVSQFTERVNATRHESGLAVGEVSYSAGQHTLRLSHLESGSSWSAHYKYYIASEGASGTGTLRGWADVQNGGEDWNDIRLRLVVGYPHIIEYVRPLPYYTVERTYDGVMAAAAPKFVPSALSAYYVYTLSEPATVKGGETRTLQLFSRNVPYRREYFWNTDWSSPQKIFRLNNTGNESWASGTYRLYLDGEFIGEDSADYTPKGMEAELSVADLPDIAVKKESLNQSTREEYRSRVTSYIFRLSIENRMDEEIDLRINDQMHSGDRVRLVSSSKPATVKPGNVLEWNVHLRKGEKLEITYEYEVTNYIRPSY